MPQENHNFVPNPTPSKFIARKFAGELFLFFGL